MRLQSYEEIGKYESSKEVFFRSERKKVARSSRCWLAP